MKKILLATLLLISVALSAQITGGHGFVVFDNLAALKASTLPSKTSKDISRHAMVLSDSGVYVLKGLNWVRTNPIISTTAPLAFDGNVVNTDVEWINKFVYPNAYYKWDGTSWVQQKTAFEVINIPSFTSSQKYLSKLNASKAKTAKLRIAFIGDSNTNRDAFTTPTMYNLQQDLGIGGIGWISASIAQNAPLLYARVRTGTILDYSYALQTNLSAALDVAELSAGATESFEVVAPSVNVTNFTPEYLSNKVTIYWEGTGLSTDSFNIKINGAYQSVQPAGAVGLRSVVVNMTQGYNNIKISNSGTGAIRFYGVNIENSTNGLVASKLGSNGSNAAHWNIADTSRLFGILRDMQPDLMVINLGSNAFTATDTINSYFQTYKAFQSKLSKAFPNTDFLHIAPTNRNTSTYAIAKKFQDSLYRMCVDSSFAFGSLLQLHESWAKGNSSGYFDDEVHYNTSANPIHAQFFSSLINVQGGGAFGSISAQGFQNTGYTKLGILPVGSGTDSIVTADANNNLRKIAAASISNANAYVQNGNSFGATAVLGTNDNNNLAFETNGTIKAYVLTSGDMLINTVRVGLGNGNIGQNTALGSLSLNNNTTGNANVGAGYAALTLNTTAAGNSAVGYNSMYNTTTGGFNSAIGSQSLYSNTIGTNNSAIGNTTLFSNTGGVYNTAVGTEALYANTTGGYNIGIGMRSGYTNTIGSNNTFVGYYADATANNLSNATAIGYNALVGGSNCLVLGATGNAGSIRPNVGIGLSVPLHPLDVFSVSGNPVRFQGLQQGASTDSLVTSENGVLKRRSVAEVVGFAVNAQLTPANASTATIDYLSKNAVYQSINAPATMTLAYSNATVGGIHHIVIAPSGVRSTVTFTGFVENGLAVTTKTFNTYTVLTVRQLTTTTAEIVDTYVPNSNTAAIPQGAINAIASTVQNVPMSVAVPEGTDISRYEVILESGGNRQMQFPTSLDATTGYSITVSPNGLTVNVTFPTVLAGTERLYVRVR